MSGTSAAGITGGAAERKTAPVPVSVGLVAAYPPRIGGVAAVVRWLLANQAAIGCTYDCFDLGGVLAESRGPLGARVALRQAQTAVRFLRWLKSAPKIVHYCVTLRPASLSRDAAYVALLRAAGHRVVAHLHGGSDLERARTSRVYRYALAAVARNSAELVTLSPSIGATLAGLGMNSRVICNPAPRHVRHPSQTRERSSGLRLLFVGVYGSDKGLQELIAALERAHATGAKATLRVVGPARSPGEGRRLRAAVAGAGLEHAVAFVGPLQSVALSRAYDDADVLCLPSLREGLPMALLEAMAAGLPALASSVGGVPDFVEEGVTGFLTEPGDVEALARAIGRLAGDPARLAAMGEAARRRVEALADPTVIRAAWRDLYQAVPAVDAKAPRAARTLSDGA